MEPALVPDPLAPLGEPAPAFVRSTSGEKAALLRAILPRLVAAAPELHALSCQSRGVDPGSAEGAPGWIAGVVPLIAGVRALAESLEAIAAGGRPKIGAVRRGKEGRARLSLRARGFAERLSAGRTRVELCFEEGVGPEEVALGQARLQQMPEGQRGQVSIAGADLAGEGLLRALHALFVEGRVVRLEADTASAALIPRLAEALAPLVEAGALVFAEPAAGEAAPAAPRAIVPWVVVPYLYAADELAFQASSLASALVLQRWMERAQTHLLVLAQGWEQRGLFLSLVEKALAALPAWRGFAPRVLEAAALDALSIPEAQDPTTLPLIALGSEDPAHFLPEAVRFLHERLGGGRGLTLSVHPSQEDDVQLGPILDEALRALRYGAIAVNAPASLIRLQPRLPWQAHPAATAPEGGAPLHNALMLTRVEKVLWRAPLYSPLKPAYFCDNRRAIEIGPRLVRLAAAPSLGALFGLLGTLRRR